MAHPSKSSTRAAKDPYILSRLKARRVFMELDLYQAVQAADEQGADRDDEQNTGMDVAA